jgi:PhnB protein
MPKPIPEGSHTIKVQLIVSPCSEAIDWYKRVFDAKERGVMPTPDGKIMHAELQIGDSQLMLMDPVMGGKSPKDLGGTNATVNLYVEDADAVWKTAIGAGAKSLLDIHDAFWGDRYGICVDPFGQQWAFATHQEDVSDAELARRAAAMFQKST